jgi:putative ABC transport system permease protein
MASFIKQNTIISLKAIKGQKLRSSLTVLIIAFGIMALVGILTATDALKASISDQFSSMGANSFTIEQLPNTRIRRGGEKIEGSRAISIREAEQFTARFDHPSIISKSFRATSSSIAKRKNYETNPNIQVTGSDENYLTVKGYDLEYGRNFSHTEVERGRHVCIIGSEINEKLFPNSHAVGNEIKIENVKYEVVGVLKEKGSSIGFSGDRNIFIPLKTARMYYASGNTSFDIHVMSSSPVEMEVAVQEAMGIMRIIRKDELKSPESFRIRRSDSLSQRLIENIRVVTIVASIIGVITLFGAAIGLMNIMLVSVTERTREIGVRKALGAKASIILQQFLIEALTICLLGGFVGILFGVGAGNAVTVLTEAPFVIPWTWISLGIMLCLFTGVIAGFYPAKKASSLDPIDALRYE